MGGKRIADVVLDAFMERPDHTIRIAFFEELGLQRGSVQTCIARLQRNMPGLRTVVQGRAWRYEPDNEPDSPAPQPTPLQKSLERHPSGQAPDWRILGQADNGDLILQDRDNVVWRATKV